jgi:hypothetical protein
MATQAHIGIKNSDGSVEAVYCNSDGYPEFTGKILKEYYTAEEKVRELIALGDMSILGSRIEPIKLTAEQVKELGVVDPATHSFENPQRGVCIFYHRDRGEKWTRCKPQRFPSEQVARYEVGSKYLYIFAPDGNGSGTWETKLR